LNQLCAVDLSSLYIDITKDRMYCDAPDSPRRRGTKRRCTKFTARFANYSHLFWSLPPRKRGVIRKPARPFTWRNFRRHRIEATKQANRWRIFATACVVGQAIEKARQDKLIGNALEAAVVLRSNSDVTTKVDKDELEEFFILSDLTIEQAKEASASVTKSLCKMRAVLAASRVRWQKQSASGFV